MRNECRGKILSLKSGYNPNSSSIGSVVFLFSTGILELTALFGAFSGLIFSRFVQNPGQSDPDEQSAVQEPESARRSRR